MTVSTTPPAASSRRRWRTMAVATVAAVTASLAVVATAGEDSAHAAGTPVRITPNPSYEGPAFEGWGTSLVWFANATGAYPEEVRQDLFDKVFGEEGLNLNIARYNIGGGNATDVPGYLRPGGAVEGWWNPDLAASDASGPITSTYADRDRYAAAWDPESPASYDFDADATQRWWLDALRDKITKWEAFSNSPPYFLTQSGFVSGGINSGTTEQLAPEDMDAFASYLVNVVEELEQTHDIDFDTLDPFNEPNTNYWSTTLGANGWPTPASRQEGAHIGPARQDLMIKALQQRLGAAGTTTDVAISAMDETNPSTFVTNWNGWTPEAKSAVSQLNVHTYGTGDRVVARDIAKSSDKPLWMSEVEGNWDTSGQGFNQTNIDNGLGMAARVADDLRELEPTAWVLWQPVEDLYNMERVEKLNWGSVFIDFDCNAEGDSARRLAAGEADPSCKVLTNAKYNTLRNYTHHIRPGDHLIPTDNTQTTAAVDGDGSGATLVHINSATSARSLTIDLSRFADIAPGASVTPIVTTESPAADPTANALVQGTAVPVDAATRTATIEVPAKSVTTLLISGVSGAAEGGTFSDGAKYQLVGQQSGKALTAPAGAGPTITTPGTTQATAQPQVWTSHVLSGEGTSTARIALQNGDGRFLASQGTSTALVSATVEQAASTPALQWMPNTTDGRSFSLLNVAAERVLDVNGQGTADGTAVGLWTSNNGTNQQWTLQSTAIAQVRGVATSTLTGTAPALPARVTIVYGQGVERTAPVTWSIAGADWSTPGVRTITGQGTDAFGASFETTATVDVGSFGRTDPVSVTTVAGVRLDALRQIAPATVPAQVGSGESRTPAAVTWNWDGLDDADFAALGAVEVSGTAVSNDPSAPALPATLTVILTAATERNVAPESTPSATFTESPSYAVTRTINGIPDDKGWSNWRSGTKNVQDTLTYALAQPEQLTKARIRFFKDGSSATWAQSLRVEHRTGTGAWTSAGTIAIDVPLAGPAPVIEVPLAGVRADQVRVVMDARPQTHLIVSEVELIALRPGPSGVADVAVITADGVPLAGVAGDVTAYTVERDGDTWPRLAAVAVDSKADVRVTQPSADNAGQGTIVVTAPSGAARTYTVAVVDAPAPALALTLATASRCVANKVVLTVTATNGEQVPVQARIQSAFGAKTITVQPGRAVSSAFSTRLGAVAAGAFTVEASAVIDGKTVTLEDQAQYAARSCG
ncbi:MAG TPA: glycoside hydrolase [Microbacterium sp.]|nr:glycoside hydrolase [Microbacterium sp.]